MNDKSNDWWKMLSEDDQMWIMIKYGFSKFKVKNVKSEQISKLYKLEHHD